MADGSPTSGGRLKVAVVTPEGAAFEGAAASVVVPAHDGEVQFLPGHAAFVGALGAGEMRIDAGAAPERWFLEGGVVEVVDDVITVLAERVRPAAGVDGAAAAKDLAEALAVVATTDVALALKERRVASARARIRIAGR